MFKLFKLPARVKALEAEIAELRKPCFVCRKQFCPGHEFKG
jgi:hypothetical protein